MKKIFRIAAVTFAAALALPCFAQAQETEVVDMKPPQGMSLAQFHFVKLSRNPAGLLVLIPGANGSPVGLINDANWRELASKHNFDIVGCYFKNPGNEAIYQRPALGSGKSLTDAVKQVYKKDLPLALYGFSAGAQYTSRFIALHPRRVKAWGAYAAGSTDQLRAGPALPPGVVVCGEDDKTRYSGLRTFYNDGRGLGYRWMWVSVPNSGHTTAPAAVEFIRSYMDTLLSASSVPSGVWVNIQDGSTGSSTRKNEFGWMPDAKLIESWKAAVGK